MKVIDLKDRTLFVDDIIQLYIEEKYSPERYNIQTTNGIYLVYKEDYFKVKDYLLSLNDEVKEDLKIYELEQEIERLSKEVTKYDEILCERNNEVDRLNNIIKKVGECIDYYAMENEDFSKFYNNEEIEILKIIGSDKK